MIAIMAEFCFGLAGIDRLADKCWVDGLNRDTNRFSLAISGEGI